MPTVNQWIATAVTAIVAVSCGAYQPVDHYRHVEEFRLFPPHNNQNRVDCIDCHRGANEGSWAVPALNINSNPYTFTNANGDYEVGKRDNKKSTFRFCQDCHFKEVQACYDDDWVLLNGGYTNHPNIFSGGVQPQAMSCANAGCHDPTTGSWRIHGLCVDNLPPEPGPDGETDVGGNGNAGGSGTVGYVPTGTPPDPMANFDAAHGEQATFPLQGVHSGSCETCHEDHPFDLTPIASGEYCKNCHGDGGPKDKGRGPNHYSNIVDIPGTVDDCNTCHTATEWNTAYLSFHDTASPNLPHTFDHGYGNSPEVATCNWCHKNIRTEVSAQNYDFSVDCLNCHLTVADVPALREATKQEEAGGTGAPIYTYTFDNLAPHDPTVINALYNASPVHVDKELSGNSCSNAVCHPSF